MLPVHVTRSLAITTPPPPADACGLSIESVQPAAALAPVDPMRIEPPAKTVAEHASTRRLIDFPRFPVSTPEGPSCGRHWVHSTASSGSGWSRRAEVIGGMRNQVLLPQCRPRPQRAATALRSGCCDQRCRRVAARPIDDRLRDNRHGPLPRHACCHVTRHLFYVPRTVPPPNNVTLAELSLD